jgi:hypothetical protein
MHEWRTRFRLGDMKATAVPIEKNRNLHINPEALDPTQHFSSSTIATTVTILPDPTCFGQAHY